MTWWEILVTAIPDFFGDTAEILVRAIPDMGVVAVPAMAVAGSFVLMMMWWYEK